MELSQVEDYAVRALVDLALHPGARIREIAARTSVPAPHLTKVLQSLARAGLVETMRGRAGGTSLARDPAEIRLREVTEAVQGPARLFRCPRRGRGCPCAPDCAIYQLWSNFQDHIAAQLETVRISDLLHTCPQQR
jgi:Rrf2 family transcriptional regulator, iron-sulfur cluster assembly transcription factor